MLVFGHLSMTKKKALEIELINSFISPVPTLSCPIPAITWKIPINHPENL
jgi:hypothetical protein